MLDTYGKKSLPNRFGNMDKVYEKMSDYDRLHKMDKARKASIEHWNNLTDDQKTALIIRRTLHFTKTGLMTSKLEIKISDCLEKLNIPHTKQFTIGRKYYDIHILNTNIIIEVNGDFWHGNPRIYKENDILNHPFKSVVAKDLWEKDNKKRILAEKKGYKIIYIWEDEINAHKKDILDFLVERLLH